MEELALDPRILLWRPQSFVSPAQTGNLVSVEVRDALTGAAGVVPYERRTFLSVISSQFPHLGLLEDGLLQWIILGHEVHLDGPLGLVVHQVVVKPHQFSVFLSQLRKQSEPLDGEQEKFLTLSHLGDQLGVSCGELGGGLVGDVPHVVRQSPRHQVGRV